MAICVDDSTMVVVEGIPGRDMSRGPHPFIVGSMSRFAKCSVCNSFGKFLSVSKNS